MLLYLSKFKFSFYLILIILLIILLCALLKKKNIKLFLLSLIGLIVPILVLEVFLVFFMPILYQRNLETLSGIKNLQIRKFRTYGTSTFFRFTTNLEETPRYYKDELIFNYIYEVYDNGFRCTKSNMDAKDGFIFLGCSFTYGHGVKDEDTLTYQFAKLYNFDKFILNCSCGGRGTNYNFSAMNCDIIYSFINKNQKINYFIYSAIEGHINRNFNISTFNLTDDYLILQDGRESFVKEPLGGLKVIFKDSYIFNKYFVDIINKKNREYHEQYFIDTVLKMDKLAKEKYDAEFIMIIWPGFEESVINKLKDLNLKIIFLDNKFEQEEYKIKNDGHPNGKANEEIAKILFNYINSRL